MSTTKGAPVNITVELRLNPNPNDSVAAFAQLVLGGEIVVHDVKLLRREHAGMNGDKFMVAMPSKKLAAPCPECGQGNHLKAAFCNRCGSPLVLPTLGDVAKMYADIIHPIDHESRGRIHFAVMQAYRAECRSTQGVAS